MLSFAKQSNNFFFIYIFIEFFLFSLLK